MTGSNIFVGNGFTSAVGSGLNVNTDGMITISNLTGSDNKLYGVSIDNYSNTWLKKYLGITLLGYNVFMNNDAGVRLATDGSVVMNHVDAYGNTNTGIDVIAKKNITLACAYSYGNGGIGLNLLAGGTPDVGVFGLITLKSVYSFANGSTNELVVSTTSLPVVRTWPCP
jgi:hypothetical protein